MAFQSAPNCAEAVVRFTRGSTEMVNRLVFKKFSGYDQDDIDALAEIVDANVGDHWLALIDGTTTYTQVHVRGLQDIVDMEAINSTHTGLGTHSGAAMPNNVTWAMRFTTGATGRSARGRMFVIGIPLSVIDSSANAVASSFASAWIAAISDLLTDASGIGWEFVVLSRFSDGAERAAAVARVVTQISYFDLETDSQRGRLP